MSAHCVGFPIDMFANFLDVHVVLREAFKPHERKTKRGTEHVRLESDSYCAVTRTLEVFSWISGAPASIVTVLFKVQYMGVIGQ